MGPTISRRTVLEAVSIFGASVPGVVLAQGAPPQDDLLQVSIADLVLGSRSAPVTIIEYASLTCDHCTAFHRDVLPRIKQEWIDTGRARLVYRDFPLDRVALTGSMLAHCAGRERYFSFVDVLYQQHDAWAHARDPLNALGRLARLGGLSDEKIRGCLADESLSTMILAVRHGAATQLGVTSTPTFFINGQRLNGSQPYAEFDAVLKAAAARVP